MNFAWYQNPNNLNQYPGGDQYYSTQNNNIIRDQYYPVPGYPPRKKLKRKKSNNCCGCILLIVFFLFVSSACILGYLIFPSRTNTLIIGIDYSDSSNSMSRSDTIILTTLNPFEPYLGMLSVPRDLWVLIPGVGENRINTAHYFAEINQRDSGPQAMINTIDTNFGIDMDHFIRFKFDAFREVVNAMGGVDITLTEPRAEYPPGIHHLTGRKALAFVRHRKTADDFFRMENGQFMAKQIVKQLMKPSNWPRIPAVFFAFINKVDTDLPVYIWPRYIFTILRLGTDGIDGRIINRDMVTPFTTDQGANVLLPRWEIILPVVNDMFSN